MNLDKYSCKTTGSVHRSVWTPRQNFFNYSYHNSHSYLRLRRNSIPHLSCIHW